MWKCAKVMRWWEKSLYVRSATQRLAAWNFAMACMDTDHAQLLADRCFSRADFPRLSPDWIDRLANPIGNQWLVLGQRRLPQYLNRHEDANAMLRLFTTVMWLRQTTTGGESVKDRLKQHPAWMQVDADRQLRVSEDGRRIHMATTFPRGNGRQHGRCGRPSRISCCTNQAHCP